jgi:quercetin dioxygenase-like cupin family protein
MDFVIPFDALESFYDEPGEYGWILDAEKHGFARVSLIITDTAPGGGPPWHQHTCEEAVVVPVGAQMLYRIGAETVPVAGPAVVRIPAGIPHAFINAGDARVSLVCVFPDRTFWDGYIELGPNPLL